MHAAPPPLSVPDAQAIACDPSDHIFFSNRSAAYLSEGDAEKALEDAEECIRLAPSFTKGYGRKGAALNYLDEIEESIEAYEAGLKVDPSNAALKEGLSEARAAQRASAPQAGGPRGGSGGGSAQRNALFGPDMMERLAANPKFAPWLADDAFVAQLKAIQSDPQSLNNSALSDPRMLEIITFLLGLGGRGRQAEGGGRPMDEEKPAPVPAPAPAPEPPVEEEEVDPEIRAERAAKAAAKKAASAKKEEGNRAYKAKDFPAALAAYAAASELDPDDITYMLNTGSVYYEQGELDKCVDVCRRAIERGRTVMAPFALIGKAFARIGNAFAKEGNLKAAIEAYESSMAESQRCVACV